MTEDRGISEEWKDWEVSAAAEQKIFKHINTFWICAQVSICESASCFVSDVKQDS